MMLSLLIVAMEVQWADRLLDFPSPPLLMDYQEELSSGVPRHGFATAALRKATNVDSPDKMTYEHVYKTLFELSQLSDRALGVIAMRFDARNVRIDPKNERLEKALVSEREMRAGLFLTLVFVEPDDVRAANYGWVSDGQQLSCVENVKNRFTPMSAWQSYQEGFLVRRKFKGHDENGIYLE